MALTRQRNLQIFLSFSRHRSRSLSLCLARSLALSLSLSLRTTSAHMPRAIHQRKSTGVLMFPFFGRLNELIVLQHSPSLSLFIRIFYIYIYIPSLRLHSSFSSWLTYLFALRVDRSKNCILWRHIFISRSEGICFIFKIL